VKLAEWDALLAKIERAYRVDRQVLVALWGVESNFGQRMGQRGLMRSLATTSCFGRRQPFFRDELFAALRIVQSGDMPVASLAGSWAGAFGQTQFMPTTFQRLAVDFDGDGRRDIVGSVPDALASTANYLKRAGWVMGQPWGFEVSLPRRYAGPSGRRNRQTLAQWHALGLRRIDRKPIAGGEMAALVLPAGARGPAFLVFANYDAIHAYNPAEAYVLAIAHLSDRLRGAGPFRAPWPTDDPALSQSERVEMQELLMVQGYDVGEADGIVGPRTVEAIKAFQQAAGLTPDGYAGARLLKALNATPLPRRGE
jgi:lytic murein transglycosylase